MVPRRSNLQDFCSYLKQTESSCRWKGQVYFTSFLGQVRWLWQKFQNCQGYRCEACSAGAGLERFTRNKPRKWLIKGMDITMVTVTDSNLSEEESRGITPRKTCWLLLAKIRLYFIVHSIHTHLTLCFNNCVF